MNITNSWITSVELLSLSGMPKHVSSIIKMAKRNGWNKRQKLGVKGVTFEYEVSSLPMSIQEQIRNKAAKEALAQQPTLPVASQPLTLAELTAVQRQCADARAALCRAVIDIEINAGLNRKKAIDEVVNAARLGVLPPHLAPMVELANARKSANRTIGTRSLNQWLLDYCKATNSLEVLLALAPKPSRKKEKPMDAPWFLMFMKHFRNPNGWSVNEAYEEFKKEWCEQYAMHPALLEAMPAIHVVRHMLNKLPKLELMRGRVTGSAWKALQPFVRRDWSVLKANDVWIGDGHGMKMKVRHPIHGNPFKPEITMIIDGTTRYIVGWSISLSENTIAISDAMRNAMQTNGVPLFYYSDNGGGQKNKVLDADVIGVLPRLGVGHETGIAGNAQGRGIIERAHQTILFRIARQFATYNGSSADRDWVRTNSVAIESAVNAENKGKELTPKQRNSLKKLPTWSQLIDAVREGIEWYNQNHQHTELPKRENGKHYTPAQYRREQLNDVDLHYLTDAELREMFRPVFERTAARGEVKMFNNIYSSPALSQCEGELVQVAVDIHDANSVIVRRLDGSYVCDAVWDGNKRAAFPVSMVEDAREKRATRRAANLNKKLEEVEAERNPHRTIEHAPDFSQLLEGEFHRVDAEEEEPIFIFPSEREEWLKKHKKAM